MVFASQKRLGRVPQNFILWFSGAMVQKRCRGGLPQLFLTSTFVSQSPSGFKVTWIVDMSHIYTSICRKRSITSFAVDVFCGLLFFFFLPFPIFWDRPYGDPPPSSGKWWSIGIPNYSLSRLHPGLLPSLPSTTWPLGRAPGPPAAKRNASVAAWTAWNFDYLNNSKPQIRPQYESEVSCTVLKNEDSPSPGFEG